jgi:Tol biopolymer transport system component
MIAPLLVAAAAVRPGPGLFRLLLLLAVPSLLVAAAACGGDDGPGVLLIGSNDGIVEYDLETASQRVIVPRPDATTNLGDPAVSPDGETVAYVVHLPLRSTDSVIDVSSDLWLVDRDGSEPRRLIEHAVPNESWDFPQWMDDTHLLVVKRNQADATDPATARYSLQAIDVESGITLEILPGVDRFGLSRDREHLAYTRLLADGRTLNVVEVGQANPVELIASDHQLTLFGTPSFSPDGESVAFTAFNRDDLFTATRTDGDSLVSRVAASGRTEVPGARLHGAHGSLFTMPVTGGEPVAVGEGFDANWQPSAAYSDDGAIVYVTTHEGLFAWDVTTGVKTTLFASGFRTEVSWAPAD